LDRDAEIEQFHRFADVGEMVILTAFTEAALVERGHPAWRQSREDRRRHEGLCTSDDVHRAPARWDRAASTDVPSRIPLQAPW
jgi:hypothetical protein